MGKLSFVFTLIKNNGAAKRGILLLSMNLTAIYLFFIPEQNKGQWNRDKCFLVNNEKKWIDERDASVLFK